MSQAKLNNNRVQIHNYVTGNQPDEKCTKELSKVNPLLVHQPYNHKFHNLILNERETHVSNHKEVRDFKPKKIEHHHTKMSTDNIFTNEFIGRKQHRDMRGENPQFHQNRNRTEMDMIPNIYSFKVPSRNPNFRESHPKNFSYDLKRQNKINPHYSEMFKDELTYWACSNPECGFNKNYITKTYCRDCNSERSADSEIIKIRIHDRNSNSYFPNNNHFKKPWINGYNQDQVIGNNSRDLNPKTHSEENFPNSLENYDRMMNKESKEQPSSELDDETNSSNQMAKSCKIIPDSSVIFSTYSHQEIEKAVTFLKLVDKIKNKQRLMKVIKEIAAEEGSTVDGDCSVEDAEKNKQKP